ncbi:LPP20 family lipoprotein [Hydrogenimonas sp.]|uniref:LPP20 family lipoprotein n=1 Tax=Hydrogenimonas sp. TaxID=2231112 RepID=UPI0026304728|nr:LPP20 family lipoprotein [Hydrogenimonas sp.]
MIYRHGLTILAAGVLLFTGCSSKNPDPDQLKSECTIGGQEAPRWVCGLHHDDRYYAAVGTAKVGKLGFGFARKEALADARANLAQQVALDVKARTTQFARSTGVGDDETVERVVENVSKQVARVTLHDSQQEAYWENPADGSIYLLVKVDRDKVDETAKQAIVSSYRNDEALWQQFQAKQALKALDEEFPGKR